MMTLKERFTKLKEAAVKDVRAVRNRRTVFSGHYPKGTTSLDGVSLQEDVRTAAQLGYETHLRIREDGTLGVYYVANMPGEPTEVTYA